MIASLEAHVHDDNFYKKNQENDLIIKNCVSVVDFP